VTKPIAFKKKEEKDGKEESKLDSFDKLEEKLDIGENEVKDD